MITRILLKFMRYLDPLLHCTVFVKQTVLYQQSQKIILFYFNFTFNLLSCWSESCFAFFLNSFKFQKSFEWLQIVISIQHLKRPILFKEHIIRLFKNSLVDIISNLIHWDVLMMLLIYVQKDFNDDIWVLIFKSSQFISRYGVETLTKWKAKSLN